MSSDIGMTNSSDAHVAQDDWLFHARFMPAPLTAPEKAAIAASLHTPSQKALNKARLALGAAAVAFAISVPNLSLEAMVGAIAKTSLIGGTSLEDAKPAPEKAAPANISLPTDVWTPAGQVVGQLGGLLYADELLGSDGEVTFGSTTRLSAFERELPVAVLSTGSQEFDLAFASVEMPSPIVALVPPGLSSGPLQFTGSRKSAIATRTLEIEQITDLDLVVRATPENVRSSQQPLAAATSSARTDAIANRSVEAAFAGAIDASSAVRGSLPVTPNRQPNEPRQGHQGIDDVRRAIPVGAPSAEVSASAAAAAVLVPKSKLDARVNGVLTGSVDFRQLDGTIAIRLRSVANMMREQFSRTEFAQITNGQAIDGFVTLAQLQAAGIPVSYNPAYDEVEFGIDYKDAPNAKKVQVDQISVPSLGSQLTAIEQIPR